MQRPAVFAAIQIAKLRTIVKKLERNTKDNGRMHRMKMYHSVQHSLKHFANWLAAKFQFVR